MTVEGAKLKQAATQNVEIPDLPMPELPAIEGTHNCVVTGVGGTGVVTVGAIMAQAAALDGKGAGMMEMAGLAQKGGAVHIHCRLAEKPEDISAIRVATGEADVVIGGDLVVTAGAKTLGLMKSGRTGAVVNSHEIITGDFTRNTEFRIPTNELEIALQARLHGRLLILDASRLARALLGDTIYSNMIVFGAAWQKGWVPLTHEAILRAIELNGAAVEANRRAFEIGRWAAAMPVAVARVLEPAVVEKPKGLEDEIAFRAEHLTHYQSTRLARRYRKLVDAIAEPRLKGAVAKGYHKLLAYKDEYEVARLLRSTAEKAREEFNGDLRLSYHLAPPLLARKGPDGRPRKIEFGPWVARIFGLLAWLKFLRGTAFDPFGHSAERKMERGLIRQYEADVAEVLSKVRPQTMDAAVALAELPLSIRGFGPVKAANVARAEKRREELLAALRDGGSQLRQAAE